MYNDHDAAPRDAPHALASEHSMTFPGLLEQLGASLLVTTYQAGHLVLLRAEGGTLNTHYRLFPRPMGVAVSGMSAIALGTRSEIIEFRNVPAASARLDPPGRHDAVYLPRRAYITGHIDVHEMAYGAGDELWYVNTLFSCLCTIDRESSFNPVWRPAFVTRYAPEDRCHLNGLALRDGHPATLSALGASDVAGGWRANKRNGGILIDYASREVLASGLSMPHSPRWHEGRLWVLESGRGALLQVDPASGATFEVARLPGFLRGLDFAGPFAFIGLCRQRDSNAFVDLPLTDETHDRQSGVWVVDTRTGATIAVLRFTGGVEEVFAVNLLWGMRWPELVNELGDLLASVYSLPEHAYAIAGADPHASR